MPVIPRFRYDFRASDILPALFSIFSPVEKIHDIFSCLFPSSEIFFVQHARTGIRHLLMSFDLKPKASIGVQPYTCSSVLAAITAAGHVPCFIDINDEMNIDANDLRNKIGKMDALIVTHIFGFPADIDKIKQIASGIPIIEDCAHALFSQYSGRQLGSFFDASVFSFGNGKFPSVGEGGMIVLNNHKFGEKLHQHLALISKPDFLNEIAYIFKSHFKTLLHSKTSYYILNKVCSARINKNRNENIQEYSKTERQVCKSAIHTLNRKINICKKRAVLQYNNGIFLSEKLMNHFSIKDSKGDIVNYFCFPLLTNKRDEYFDLLKQKNIFCGKHFAYSLIWAKNFGYRDGDCPNFEKNIRRIFTIPCNYSISMKDMEFISRTILESVRKT